MIVVTALQLIRCGVSPTQAKAFEVPISEAMSRYVDNTPEAKAAFVAQTMWESTRFSALEENLYYSTVAALWGAFERLHSYGKEGIKVLLRNPPLLANTAYAHINGNGDFKTGDGWRYRGSGLIGLTGKGNFAAAQKAIGRPYISMPELVRQPTDAALTAGWFWDAHLLNEKMAGGREKFDETTRVINGRKMLGARGRRELFSQALPVFQ